MNDDPSNRLPLDPDWLRKIDKHAKAAAKDLGCMVLMISVQEGGKMCASFSGVPKSGDLHELAKDVPSLLGNLALIAAMQEELGKQGPKQ